MLNFSFYNPTQIIFGKGQMEQLDNLVPKNAKILITYGGGSVKKFGTLEKVKIELNKSNREIFELGGIEPNPQFLTLMKAVKIVRDENIDFIIAVGGGSVMDGTKFIAGASFAKDYYGNEDKLIRSGFSKIPADQIIPFGTVVTLPATGSEMNCGGVISDGKDKLVIRNVAVFPKFSILDPELTFTLPKTQVANGIIDTFVHVVEQYVTKDLDTKFQDRTAEGILNTLIEIADATIDEPNNYDARANLVLCSTMALNGVIGSGVAHDWSTHMIGHEITGLYGIDHAKSLAIVLPAMWRVRKENKKAKLLQYADRVWNIKSGTEDEIIENAITKTEKFFQSLGVETRLSDYDLNEKNIDEIIDQLKKHSMTNLSESNDLSLELSKKVLQKAL